jgi:hypothetical protein
MFTRPAFLDVDYGEPVGGVCAETGSGTGVFVRNYSRADVTMDCNSAFNNARHAAPARCARSGDPSDPNNEPHARPATINQQRSRRALSLSERAAAAPMRMVDDAPRTARALRDPS